MRNNEKNVLAIVLAGGEGKRLSPLTENRAKPAVPYGGVYRLIDFPLSNLINSGITKITILTQYKSQSLDQHIARSWRLSMLMGDYISTVPAQQRTGKNWYLGSADAIFQNLNIINDENPDYIIVLGADHVYKMDIEQLLDYHIRSKKSLTVCGIRQPLEFASEFGVINGDGKGGIKSFVEKPKNPQPMPEDKHSVLASMGNYVFTASALIDIVTKDAKNSNSKHDMGGDIVPYFVKHRDAVYYDFYKNRIPGSRNQNAHYWRDVGTLDAYYDANMDLLSHNPLFDLYNPKWPIYTGNRSGLPPAKFVSSTGPKKSNLSRSGKAEGSCISYGVIVSGGEIYNSVISPSVKVHYGATVENSVVMDNVNVGRFAKIKNAIIDKNVRISDNTTIGFNKKADEARGFIITDNGITVVKKNTVI